MEATQEEQVIPRTLTRHRWPPACWTCWTCCLVLLDQNNVPPGRSVGTGAAGGGFSCSSWV